MCGKRETAFEKSGLFSMAGYYLTFGSFCQEDRSTGACLPPKSLESAPIPYTQSVIQQTGTW